MPRLIDRRASLGASLHFLPGIGRRGPGILQSMASWEQFYHHCHFRSWSFLLLTLIVPLWQRTHNCIKFIILVSYWLTSSVCTATHRILEDYGCAMTIGKLFTPFYPCRQALLSGTWTVTLWDWEDNRSFGISLAVRYRLHWSNYTTSFKMETSTPYMLR